LSLILAVAVLVSLYIFLPQLRELYQEQYRTPQLDAWGTVATTAESRPGTEQTPEELLKEWRTKRNTIVSDDQEGVDPAEDAAENLSGLRIIRSIPQTEAEIQRVHESSRRLECEFILPGEPVSLNDYKGFLTQADLNAKKANDATSLFSRREIISIGFDMRDADRQQLPSLSSGKIMKFLQESYVSLQVRIEKDPVESFEYLNPRPLATLVEFGRSRISQPPKEALADSLKNYRGLGMYVPQGETPTLQSMRTLVLLHRSSRKELDSTANLIKPHYEFVFVRAVPDVNKKLKLHTFVTSEDRTYLNYLRDNRTPTSPQHCTIRTMLAFTEYDYSGLEPIESVTTGSITDHRSKLTIEELNAFVSSRGLSGTALDNLPVVLDAVINGEIGNPE
jgi:hypothetical protein